MPMVMVAAIAFRAIFLRRLLEREGIRVIETWPAGALRRIQGVDERVPSHLDAATRARLVLRRVDDPGQQLQQQGLPLDVLDAVAAALAAWAEATGRSHRVEVDGWPDEGSIVLPGSVVHHPLPPD